jgi:hypothetical protein
VLRALGAVWQGALDLLWLGLVGAAAWVGLWALAHAGVPWAGALLARADAVAGAVWRAAR